MDVTSNLLYMRSLYLAIASLLILAACSPIYMVDKSEFVKIPKGSKQIVVKSSVSSDSLFSLVSRTFVREGWIVKSDRSAMQISAEPKSVGKGTALKPLVYIEDGAAHYSGEWGLDQDGQIMLQSMTRGVNTVAFSPIAFQRNGTTKNDVAFQGLLILAKKIPNSAIEYLP